jgi:hypothetical protein
MSAKAATSATARVNSSRSACTPLRAMRSSTRSRWGEVNVPAVRPCATNTIELILLTDVLPFVPATWITG